MTVFVLPPGQVQSQKAMPPLKPKPPITPQCVSTLGMTPITKCVENIVILQLCSVLHDKGKLELKRVTDRD